MLNDPIVIVGAARTPMGGFHGRFRAAGGERSRRGRDQGRRRARRHQARRRAGSDHGQRASRRPGAGAGAPGVDQGRPSACDRLYDSQQDVRLGDEGGDARARSHRRGHQRHHGRRRNGVDDQRAVPAAEGARRLPDGPPDRGRPHVHGRPRGRVRQGPPDGHVRRGMRGQVRVHARGAGRLCADLALARARREQRWHVRVGDRAGHRRRKERAAS